MTRRIGTNTLICARNFMMRYQMTPLIGVDDDKLMTLVMSMILTPVMMTGIQTVVKVIYVLTQMIFIPLTKMT